LPDWKRPLPLAPDVTVAQWLAELTTASVLLARLGAGSWGHFFVRQALARHIPKPPAPPPTPPPAFAPGTRAGPVLR